LRRSNSGICLLLACLHASDDELSSSEEHLPKNKKRGTIYMKQAGGYM